MGVFAKFRDESCPEAIGFSRSMGGLSSDRGVSLVPLGLNIAYLCAELGFFGIERADQRTDGIQMLCWAESLRAGEPESESAERQSSVLSKRHS